MVAYRKVTAKKNRVFTEPVQWVLNHGNRAIIHKIDNIELVMTKDGIMMLAALTSVADLYKPDCNVAMMIGKVKVLRKSGAIDPNSPELWFYDDNFWVKARDPDGTPCYLDHRWLLYTVEVDNIKQLWQDLVTGFEPPKPE